MLYTCGVGGGQLHVGKQYETLWHRSRLCFPVSDKRPAPAVQLPWGEQSHQYRWLEKDLAAGECACLHSHAQCWSMLTKSPGVRWRIPAVSPCADPACCNSCPLPPPPPCPSVDRKATPFVVVFFHASIYHSYVQQYMQANTFRTVMGPLFVEHGVDLVFAGHVHRCAPGLAGRGLTASCCPA